MKGRQIRKEKLELRRTRAGYDLIICGQALNFANDEEVQPKGQLCSLSHPGSGLSESRMIAGKKQVF